MLRAHGSGMGHFVQRLGISIGRGGVVLILLALVLAGGAYWIGPAWTPPPQLRLVVLTGDSAAEQVSVRGTYDEATQQLRFELPLAVQNLGPRADQPRRVEFSVPGRFAVSTRRGRLTGEVTPGVPLRRYTIELAAPAVQPGAPPRPLQGLDTIWLEPDLPRYYCAEYGDGIPEFVPAPQYDGATMAEVRIFYSLSMRQTQERSTGLLTVMLDPQQLDVTPAAMPPTYPTVFQEPEVEAPELGPLLYRGSRTAWCGDPEQPMELFAVSWATAGGSRFYVIHVRGQPRKHLYDINGDGVIDLETWDIDGDGRFEARRQARFPVPEFLIPLPVQRADLLLPDTVPPDSAWLALFHNVGAGPLRFALDARTAARPSRDPAVASEVAATMEPLPPPDSAWLRLFLDTGAGPFRFTRRAPVQPPRGLTPDVARDTVPGEPPLEPDTVAPPDTATPAPRPAPRQRPLGTPVPTPRRDTIPR
jgi:hypothetical protein